MDINLRQELAQNQVQRMQMGMQMSVILEKPGEDFWSTVREIENSEIFLKLHQMDKSRKVISIIPIKRFIPLSDVPVPDTSSLIDNEVSLEGFEEIVSRIRRLGQDRFRCFFIDGEGTNGEVAEILGVAPDLVRQFRHRIIDRVQLIDAVTGNSPSLKHPRTRRNGEVTAEVIISNGKVHVDYSRHRNRYRINEDRLSELIEKRHLTDKELSQYKKIRRQMDWINFRFDLLYRVVKQTVEHQEDYLEDDDPRKLKVLEIRDLARELGVDPSWVSRLIRDKYIRIRGRALKLRELFISSREMKKRMGKMLLKKVLLRQKERLEKKIINRPYSDQALTNQLRGEFSLKVTRRSVNNWRREIEKEEPDVFE